MSAAPGHAALVRSSRGARGRRAAGRRASTSKDAVETGQDFTFVAPGGQTTILYDPPESRGALRDAVGGEPARAGHDDRARRSSPAASSCSTSGARGAGRAAPRPRTCSSSRSRRPRTGCRCSGSTCATTARRPPTSSATAASPTTRCSTRPAARWPRCRGYPRNTVPSTIVLDRQHRVAAVYLTAVRVPELIPLVQRLAAEPAPEACHCVWRASDYGLPPRRAEGSAGAGRPGGAAHRGRDHSVSRRKRRWLVARGPLRTRSTRPASARPDAAERLRPVRRLRRRTVLPALLSLLLRVPRPNRHHVAVPTVVRRPRCSSVRPGARADSQRLRLVQHAVCSHPSPDQRRGATTCSLRRLTRPGSSRDFGSR